MTESRSVPFSGARMGLINLPGEVLVRTPSPRKKASARLPLVPWLTTASLVAVFMLMACG